MLSRFFPILSPLAHLYGRASRCVTLGVRGIAFDATGRLALVRHTYVAGWHLPGGAVEVGETAEAAMRREWQEEARVVAGAVRLHGVFLNVGPMRRDHVLVFVAHGVTISGPRPPDGEILEAGFFPLDALPEGTSRSTHARLAELAEGLAPAALW